MLLLNSHYYNISDFARASGVRPQTIRYHVITGNIKAFGYKIGKRIEIILIPKSELRAYIAKKNFIQKVGRRNGSLFQDWKERKTEKAVPQ